MTTEEISSPIHIAVVGCGQIGRLHAERLAGDARVRITAFCDRALDSATTLRDQFSPEAVVFTDVTQMLATVSLDAVVICTPTMLHYEQVLACRERGLPVLCEKPLAETRERIVKLVELANSGGPLLSVAYQRRHWAIYRTLRRELQSGRWGPLQAITLDMAERWQQTIGGTWRDDPLHNPGGFLGDAGSHKVDVLFYLTGLKPAEVFAVSSRHGSQVEIVTSITGKLAGDVTLSMNLIGNAEHWHEDIHVYCAEADFIVKEGRLWRAENNELHEVEFDGECSDPDRGFVDCLIEGADNRAPADCALAVVDFTAMVLESSRTGLPVRRDC